MDGTSFESGKEKLQIQKYPDTCGRGLNLAWSRKHIVNVNLPCHVLVGYRAT